MSSLGDVLSELVFLKRFADRGRGRAPSRNATFWNFVKKKVVLIPLDHISPMVGTSPLMKLTFS